MRVLLVNANTYRPLAPPPVGLSLLVAPLRRAGHVVRVTDLMMTRDPDAALGRALARAAPDLVGLSLRNLDNQDIRAPRDFVPDYVRWVAQAEAVAPTVIGGSAVMSAPEALWARTGATYAMVGQAESALPCLADELAAGRQGDFTAPGLLWRQDGRLRRNPGRFDGYPAGGGTINWSAIDARRYRSSPVGAACLITKTGCPHQCAFCDAAQSFGGRFVPRPPEAIVEDLRRDARERGLHRSGYFFIDAVFNEPLDWAKQVLEALVRFEKRLSFGAIVEPTRQFDRELAGLLRRAGCTMVTCLLGSLDDAVLARSRRPFLTADVHRALGLLEDAGVGYMPQLLLGGPGETRATVLGNLGHLRRRRPLFTLVSYGLRIPPVSRLRDIAVDEGLVAADDDLLAPTFYLAEALRGQEPWLRRQTARLSRMGLVAVSNLPQWGRYLAHDLRVRWQR